MYRFCAAKGLKQLVKNPTRENLLLDFVISDLQARMVKILPANSDRNMVLASFDIGISKSMTVTRLVFDYSKADCATITCNLVEFH